MPFPILHLLVEFTFLFCRFWSIVLLVSLLLLLLRRLLPLNIPHPISRFRTAVFIPFSRCGGTSWWGRGRNHHVTVTVMLECKTKQSLVKSYKKNKIFSRTELLGREIRSSRANHYALYHFLKTMYRCSRKEIQWKGKIWHGKLDFFPHRTAQKILWQKSHWIQTFWQVTSMKFFYRDNGSAFATSYIRIIHLVGV